MLKNQKNTNMKGNVGVGSAIQYFTSEGFVVSLPLSDSQPYDLIVDTEKGLKRVQVKTSTRKEGISWEVGLRTVTTNTKKTNNKSLDKSAFDILFILVEDGTRWLIPVESIEGCSSINVGGDLYGKFIV